MLNKIDMWIKKNATKTNGISMTTRKRNPHTHAAVQLDHIALHGYLYSGSALHDVLMDISTM